MHNNTPSYSGKIRTYSLIIDTNDRGNYASESKYTCAVVHLRFNKPTPNDSSLWFLNYGNENAVNSFDIALFGFYFLYQN